jgi:DNA-binding response OmpR family regulator
MNTTQRTFSARILVADDEENTRKSIVRALELRGYQSEGASNGREVLEKLKKFNYSLLLLDLNMPDIDGVEVMQFIREQNIKINVIVLTAYATLNSAIAAIKAGAVDYLLKPQRISDIEKSIQHALAQNSTRLNRSRLIEVIQQTLLELQGEENALAEKPLINQTTNNDEETALIYDYELRQVTVQSGSRLRKEYLTADQAAILSFLIGHPGKVMNCMEISLKALGCHCESKKEAERIIRPHILRLRRKIEVDPDHPAFIRTIRGGGYAYFPPQPPVLNS